MKVSHAMAMVLGYLAIGTAYALIDEQVLVMSDDQSINRWAFSGFFAETGGVMNSTGMMYAQMILAWPIAIPYALITRDPVKT